MKFYQLTVTTKYMDVTDKMYKNVVNYSTLALAMSSHFWKDKENLLVAEGEEYNDSFGRECCQFHNSYIDVDGRATLELQHHYIGIHEGSTVKQTIYMESIYIKEVVLEDK